MGKRLILVLGGVRSGKSAYADDWAIQNGQGVLYVATAQAGDDEMQARIERHRASRPADWHTLEAARDVASAIEQNLTGYDVILLDCLTVLTANILLDLPEDVSEDDANAAAVTEIDNLLRVYAANDVTWLVVSNEVGMGVVPPSRLGRFFRDMLGLANQRFALAADEVILMVAGLPWKLKP
jgi:adenosylcobinamide kinase/adenosylcobinamide-phosphate guanylyltransferase